jgi:hypothetical protein
MYLCLADISSEGRTRIWGFRPPVPPLRGANAAPQTPPRMYVVVGWRSMWVALTYWLRGRVWLVLSIVGWAQNPPLHAVSWYDIQAHIKMNLCNQFPVPLSPSPLVPRSPL